MLHQDKKEINPQMISLARESRFLTQKELSDLLEIEQGSISKVESGLINLSEANLDKLSSILEYPKDFFYLNNSKQYIDLHNHFRKKKNISKVEENGLKAKINILSNHIRTLIEPIEFTENRIKFLTTEEYTPEEVAIYTRKVLNIGDGVIINLTKLLEDAGIIIVPLGGFEVSKFSGASVLLNKSIPVIFYNPEMPGDRMRFTIAHELGHIVMHKQSIPEPIIDIEKEANSFAAEFLMPSKEVKPFLMNLDLQKMSSLKAYWKVSMGAILERARKDKVITDSQYKFLRTNFMKKGYHINEPINIPKEIPTLNLEIIDIYIKELKYSKSDLSKILAIREKELNEIYFSSTKLRLVV